MPDRWRDEDRDYGYYDDDSYNNNSYNNERDGYERQGRSRRDNWRHDAYEENDWKRRRTNDDSYEPVPNHRYEDNGGDDYYEDREYERGDNYGSRRRMKPSDPSSHVIFLGLHPDFTEENVRSFTLI
ncbi:hypothetical protein DL93DRAFT_1475665 [Clavulina sp. PMI_390]|nr:hypothetical protein DL93DRAFT_1475665 [Clavulina sp. PMI_390]